MCSLLFRIALKSSQIFKNKAKGTSYLPKKKKRQNLQAKLLILKEEEHKMQCLALELPL